jgi:hypothetical protein
VEESGAATVFATADAEATGLVVGGVRGARYLAVVVAARHPGFQVELAVGGAAEVASADVHDAVREAEALEDKLLDVQHLRVQSLRLFWRREGKHLHLGELVDAVEAATRPAVGAGLRPKAVGEPGEPDRQFFVLNDLIGK